MRRFSEQGDTRVLSTTKGVGIGMGDISLEASPCSAKVLCRLKSAPLRGVAPSSARIVFFHYPYLDGRNGSEARRIMTRVRKTSKRLKGDFHLLAGLARLP